MEMYRRQFTMAVLLGGFATGLLSYDTQAASSPRIVQVHPVPNRVRPFKPADIGAVVTALESGIQVGRSSYVPLFIDILQRNYYDRTGFTYEAHQPVISHGQNKNPIQVEITDGFIASTGNKKQAEAVHRLKTGEKNSVIVDASFKSPRFLHFLDHELVHIVHGEGELRAYAHTHRNIAKLVATYPDLLRNNDDHDPLMDLMSFYIGRNRMEGGNLITSMTKDVMIYLQLLDATLPDRKKADVQRAAEFLTNNANQTHAQQQIEPIANEQLQRRGIIYVKRLAELFTDLTEKYILEQNPKFPEDKKQLLDRKLSKLRNF